MSTSTVHQFYLCTFKHFSVLLDSHAYYAEVTSHSTYKMASPERQWQYCDMSKLGSNKLQRCDMQKHHTYMYMYMCSNSKLPPSYMYLWQTCSHIHVRTICSVGRSSLTLQGLQVSESPCTNQINRHNKGIRRERVSKNEKGINMQQAGDVHTSLNVMVNWSKNTPDRLWLTASDSRIASSSSPLLVSMRRNVTRSTPPTSILV